MGASVLEKKMHYPVMSERQVAFRWKISLKTLRLDGERPIWHKLFQHVRNHEADILEFERQSAQHWMAILGDGERVPRTVTHPPKTGCDPQPSDTAEPGPRSAGRREGGHSLHARAWRAYTRSSACSSALPNRRRHSSIEVSPAESRIEATARIGT